ncbi:MAG: winged helix-turn-helix transcriptional regulator [Chloroflexi bacterium]|nr:winged helix-turn-helix transcriptional regulator [Chloroflexota bacterium]
MPDIAAPAKDPVKLERARTRLARHTVQNGMARLRKALCDPARLQIIEALTTGDICVGDLALAISRAPAATSQHLRVLRDLGLVEPHRRGTTIYYGLQENDATKQLEAVLTTLAAQPEEESA